MAHFVDPAKRPEPVFNAPAVVLWLCGILILVHAVQLLATPSASMAIAETFVLQPAVFASGLPGLLPGMVQLLGHMFLHVGLMHLLANAVWLLIFGAILARRVGAGLFVAFFLVCGVGAGAFYLGLDTLYAALGWTHGLGVAGASGAISGLMGAVIRFAFVRPRWYLDTPPLARLGDRTVISWTIVWVGLNAGIGVAGQLDPAFQGVAWEAHVGGFLVGLLLYPLFDRLRAVTPRP